MVGQMQEGLHIVNDRYIFIRHVSNGMTIHKRQYGVV